jgi:hypothetical protein
MLRSLAFLIALTLAASAVAPPAAEARTGRAKGVKRPYSFKRSVKKFHKYIHHTPAELRKYLTSDERKRDISNMRQRDEVYLKQLWKLSARQAREICMSSVKNAVSEPCLRAQTQKVDVAWMLFEKYLARHGESPRPGLKRALASE